MLTDKRQQHFPQFGAPSWGARPCRRYAWRVDLSAQSYDLFDSPKKGGVRVKCGILNFLNGRGPTTT